MSERGLVRYVFTSSYTSQGFYTFIPELINGLKKVYILKGAPGTGKSTFIRLLGEMMSEQGGEVEFWISAMDSVTPDGIYLPQFEIAVVNGSLPVSIDPRYPGVREHIINLGEYWDEEIIDSHRLEIINLIDEMTLAREQACKCIKESSKVKAEIRQLNAQFINMENLSGLTQRIASEIFTNQAGEKHYFAGALTVDGLVDYVHSLSQGCQKRYIFKGPTGSGKSMLIGELARQARERGYFLEYYHCGLELEDLTMVIIRNLQVALIEVGNMEIPAKPWDIVADLSECLDDVEIGDLIEGNNSNYRIFERLLLEAQQQLELSNQRNKALKKIYAGAMDFAKLDQIRHKLLEEINKMKS